MTRRWTLATLAGITVLLFAAATTVFLLSTRKESESRQAIDRLFATTLADEHGRVDTVFRTMDMTLRQLVRLQADPTGHLHLRLLTRFVDDLTRRTGRPTVPNSTCSAGWAVAKNC